MREQTNPTMRSSKGRTFSCFPVAVIVVIIDEGGRLLLLSRKGGRPGWQVVGGALEAGETVLEGALRETREEAGGILVRPLGVAHTCTYRFDDVVREMIDVVYVMAFEGGEVIPGSDMAGSQVTWPTLDEIVGERVPVSMPREGWFLERAV